ncbi:hypothetical protein GGX14DRAFT_544608 [Mycena pura]|uniref:Restriction of telomere capping protein 4 C-terminal domain-containing protein n=1 Tax=Mycena pura TaxID=153505 RepID=A0AAD6V484_9AGAR|nr:hypothetical protein GGX14DRAFT_544608 [Mycena pura]
MQCPRTGPAISGTAIPGAAVQFLPWNSLAGLRVELRTGVLCCSSGIRTANRGTGLQFRHKNCKQGVLDCSSGIRTVTQRTASQSIIKNCISLCARPVYVYQSARHNTMPPIRTEKQGNGGRGTRKKEKPKICGCGCGQTLLKRARKAHYEATANKSCLRPSIPPPSPPAASPQPNIDAFFDDEMEPPVLPEPLVDFIHDEPDVPPALPTIFYDATETYDYETDADSDSEPVQCDLTDAPFYTAADPPLQPYTTSEIDRYIEEMIARPEHVANAHIHRNDAITEQDRDNIRAIGLKIKSIMARDNFDLMRRAFEHKMDIDSEWVIFRRLQRLTDIQPIYYDCCVNSCLAFTGDYSPLEACATCGEARWKPNGDPRRQYAYIPLIPRLQGYFSSKKKVEQLLYRHNYTHERGVISDVFDGRLYREARKRLVVVNGVEQDYTYFSGEFDIALGFATDGFLIFEHRKKGPSATPIILQNYNIPPEERTHLGQLISTGCIPGPHPPKDMRSFVLPLDDELVLLALGVDTYNAYTDSIFKMRAYNLFGLGDILAIEKILNIKGHNGISPCRSCEIKGQRNTVINQTIYYVPLAAPEMDGVLRAKWDPLQLPKRSEETFQAGLQEIDTAALRGDQKRLAQWHGLNGLPALRQVGSMQRARSYPWDMMHLFFENIIPNLVKLWRGTFKNIPQGVYVMDEDVWTEIWLETSMAMATIPAEFSRSLACGIDKFTAEAWCFWFVYMAPGLLRKRLLDKYHQHACQLVVIIKICLKFTITRKEVKVLRLSIAHWVEKYEELYYLYKYENLSVCTLTIHGLLHLADGILDCGPGWTNWAFFIERYCGFLKHGLRSKSHPWPNLTKRILSYAYLEQLGVRFDLEAELSLVFPKKVGLSRREFMHDHYDRSILGNPYQKLHKPCDELKMKIAQYLTNLVGAGVTKRAVRAILPNTMPRWGKVRIIDGDAIRAASVSELGADTSRDNTFVRCLKFETEVEEDVDGEKAWMTRLYYGRLDEILECQLPREHYLGQFSGQLRLIAVVTPCRTSRNSDATREILTYSKLTDQIVVDLAGVAAVVGRFKTRGSKSLQEQVLELKRRDAERERKLQDMQAQIDAYKAQERHEKLIGRPPGTAGRVSKGFKLQPAMGLDQDSQRYHGLGVRNSASTFHIPNPAYKRIVFAEASLFLDISKCYQEQSEAQLVKAREAITKKVPFLRKFQGNWATDVILQQRLKNSSTDRRRDQIWEEIYEERDRRCGGWRFGEKPPEVIKADEDCVRKRRKDTGDARFPAKRTRKQSGRNEDDEGSENEQYSDSALLDDATPSKRAKVSNVDEAETGDDGYMADWDDIMHEDTGFPDSELQMDADTKNDDSDLFITNNGDGNRDEVRLEYMDEDSMIKNEMKLKPATWESESSGSSSDVYEEVHRADSSAGLADAHSQSNRDSDSSVDSKSELEHAPPKLRARTSKKAPASTTGKQDNIDKIMQTPLKQLKTPKPLPPPLTSPVKKDTNEIPAICPFPGCHDVYPLPTLVDDSKTVQLILELKCWQDELGVDAVKARDAAKMVCASLKELIVRNNLVAEGQHEGYLHPINWDSFLARLPKFVSIITAAVTRPESLAKNNFWNRFVKAAQSDVSGICQQYASNQPLPPAIEGLTVWGFYGPRGGELILRELRKCFSALGASAATTVVKKISETATDWKIPADFYFPNNLFIEAVAAPIVAMRLIKDDLNLNDASQIYRILLKSTAYGNTLNPLPSRELPTTEDEPIDQKPQADKPKTLTATDFQHLKSKKKASGSSKVRTDGNDDSIVPPNPKKASKLPTGKKKSTATATSRYSTRNKTTVVGLITLSETRTVKTIPV